jgi:large subunit ribosomal protein L7/L12
MDDITVEAVVEKTTFDVKLIGFDAKNKIKVIKEVRSMTNLGLKEAKELVEGVPATLRKNIKREEAEELKVLLEGLGAQVEIV